MSRKISKRDNRYLARLVTGERAPCAFCLRETDDEVTYGKLYAIGDIQCHYFCCLLSCCLIQKGHDEEGLFGFMYTDILAEVERCKKHKCSYCGRSGANLGCSVGACRKQFHVPCGRDKNAVSLYYGSYKSFCQQHAPKQKIPDHIMEKARQRMRMDRSKGKLALSLTASEPESTEEMVCVICYETVDGFPTVNTFWPPCCGKDAWFHRTCLQRMALSAGMHYLKCPLCNDKESFYDAVVSQGYYVPDRDAAWELEQNAFAEIYERPASCSAENCLCPLGRSHDAETGQWDIKLCLLCGSAGAHAQCIDQSQPPKLNSDQSETSQTPSINQSENMSTTTDQSELRDLKRLSLVENVSKTEEPNLSMEQTNQLENSIQLNNTPNRLNISPDQLNSSSNQLNPFSNQSYSSSDQLNPTSNQLSPISNQSRSSSNQLNPSSNQSNSSRNQLESPVKWNSVRFVCRSCLPAAPEDLNALVSNIEAIIQQEQSQTTAEARRPLMTARMSIRRTKGRRAIVDRPSTSRSNSRAGIDSRSSESSNVLSSRLELNLKTPRRVTESVAIETNFDNKLASPVKLLEQSFREKMVCTGVRDVVLDEAVIETLRRRFRKPRPMCERKRIVNDILDGLFDDLMKDSKRKEQVKEWRSPRKSNSEDTKGVNESSKEVEKCQNKENDSNMSNTTSIDTNNIKIEEDVLNLRNKNEDIENNAVGDENNDPKFDTIDDSNSDVIQNETNHERKTKNTTELCKLSKSETNAQSDANIQEISTSNSEDSCDVRRNEIHVSKSCEQNDTKIVDTPAKEAKENRLTRNSATNIKSTEKNKSNEIKHKNPIKIKFFRKDNKSRGVDKSKHFVNSKSNKDRKIRSKSESSTDINILKRLLTEKDLCSQLLLELTTGKVNKSSTNSKITDKCDKKDDSPPKSVKDTSILDDPKDKTPDNVNTTPKSKEHLNVSNDTKSTHNTPKSSSKKRSKRSSNSGESPKSRTRNDKSSNTKDSKSNKSTENSKSEETSMKINDVQALASAAEILEDTLSLIEKKHKTIDIQQDSSLEISENDQHISIDVIKIEDSPTTDDSHKKLNLTLPDQLKKCYKFNPTGDVLDKNDVDMDLESFKKEYLSEVDRGEFKCNFKHKHVGKGLEERKFRSPIDFAIEAAVKKEAGPARITKRKLTETGVKLIFDNTVTKRRKVSEGDLKLSYDYDKNIPDNLDDGIEKKVENNEGRKTERSEKRRRKKESKEKRNKREKAKRNHKEKRNKSPNDKNIEVTIDSSEKRSAKNKRVKKKIKTKFAIQNENIQVKIKWKKKQFSLNIESKKQVKKEKNSKDDRSKFKQYVLQFPEGSSKEVLVKPEKEVCPLKRKYIKNEKSPDKLKQMSIQSFFKLKSEK